MSKMCCGLFDKGDDGADDSYDNDTALPPPTSTIATVSETMAAVPAEIKSAAAPVQDASAAAVEKVTIATTEAAEAAPEMPATIVAAVSEAAPYPEPAVEEPSVEAAAEPAAEMAAAAPVKVEEEEAVAVPPPGAAAMEPVAAVEEAKEEPRAAAAASAKPAVSAPKDDFDIEAFKAKMNKGITVTKYNRHGKSAARILYYEEADKTISWGEVGAGHHRRSSSFLRHVEAPLPVSQLSKVLPASKATHTFFRPADATRSFQLVFSHRTVDITAQSDADARYIATGLERLKASA